MNRKPFALDHAAIKTRLDAALVEGLNASLLAVSRLTRKRLSQAGTGFKRAKYRSSAPNFPPAVQTNRLRASWTIDKVGRTSADGSAEIIKQPINPNTSTGRYVLRLKSMVPYAAFLEYGTRSMKPRPYIRVALESTKPILPRLFATAFRRNFAQGIK